MTNVTKLSDLLLKKNYRTKKLISKKKPDIKDESHNCIRVVDNKIVLGNADNFKVSKDIQYDTKINDDDVIETSRTFTKRLKNSRWNLDATNIFYEALQICGTDFSLMCEIFVEKDRRQLKNKYKNEIKNNTKRITSILRLRTQYNSEEIRLLKERYLRITKT